MPGRGRGRCAWSLGRQSGGGHTRKAQHSSTLSTPVRRTADHITPSTTLPTPLTSNVLLRLPPRPLSSPILPRFIPPPRPPSLRFSRPSHQSSPPSHTLPPPHPHPPHTHPTPPPPSPRYFSCRASHGLFLQPSSVVKLTRAEQAAGVPAGASAAGGASSAGSFLSGYSSVGGAGGGAAAAAQSDQPWAAADVSVFRFDKPTSR